MKYTKAMYVMINKPLVFKSFELYAAPTGWYRLDLLRNRIIRDKEFAVKFTHSEIKEIME